jgi:hypothetical protein
MFINFQAIKYSILRITFSSILQISKRLANINHKYIPFQISDVYAVLCRVLHMDNQRWSVSMFANCQVVKFENYKTYGMKGWGGDQD